MVNVNLNNPAQGFYFFDPINMGLPGINSLQPVTAATDNTAPSTSASVPCTTAPVNAAVGAAAAAAASTTGSGGVAGNTVSFTEDLSKKVRKPYTITKSRESWTDQEHDKFLEALQLFDRDWKKIEAFVGSKTVIQIRSHAQKYFLKVQKSGTPEHVPPPRPKRKAAHPYPQKAPKNASPVVSQLTGPLPSSSTALEPGYVYRPDPSSSALGNPVSGGALFSWSYCSVPPVSVPQISKDDVGGLYGPSSAHNCCYSSSNESTPRALQTSEMIDRGDHGKPLRVMPDFGQVYSFIGSVFDPDASNHLQRLKQMDPINLETILLLMRNLSVNLTSPEFEDHRQLLASHDVDTGTSKSDSFHNNIGGDNLGSAISAA